MFEKISEMPIRQEKVNKLKDDLFNKIVELWNEDYQLLCSGKLESMSKVDFNINNSYIRKAITELHYLYALREFLNDEFTFMNVVNANDERDVIIYEVDIDTLDWMAQEENLLYRILSAIDKCGGRAEIVLCDRFFKYDVCTIVDRVLWRLHNEENSEGGGS